MPDYKRRKHNRILSAPKKPKKQRLGNVGVSDIGMAPYSGKRVTKPPENMKVVKGRKPEKRRRGLKTVGILALLAAVALAVHIVIPAGIFETAANYSVLLGKGSYPIELESTETLNTVCRGSYYYVLTDSYISAFSNSGKKLFSYAHGFENPVLKLSAVSAAVFDRGGTELLIFNNKGLKHTLTTEQSIITAAVSDSGVYAAVTHSDKYASEVAVYSAKNNLLYEWYSAAETVNNAVISPNGKKLAVSGFDSGVGQYKSKIYVLNLKSATPEYTEALDGDLVYSLDSTLHNGFTVVTENKIKHIRWSKYKATEYSNDYTVSFYKAGKSGAVAVFGRESDKTDNRIAVFSSSGELKAELQYKLPISDIQLFGNHIYCISDTEVVLLGTDGEVLRTAGCGFGAVRLAVTGTNNAAVITDNRIEKIKLEQE